MPTHRPKILSIGTANPPKKYTQADIISRFRAENPLVRAMFNASHIKTRYLYLPPPDPDGRPVESQGELLRKHRKGALELGEQAIAKALQPLGIATEDVDYLCCVSSTGFMLPGLTAMYIKHLGFRSNCHRTDVVGMGCNAGLNALNPVVNWAKSNPTKTALMVCCEVNSALYVYDDSIATGVVNSLFGDGCAAIVVRSEEHDDHQSAPQTLAPHVLGFASHIITEAWDAMRY